MPGFCWIFIATPLYVFPFMVLRPSFLFVIPIATHMSPLLFPFSHAIHFVYIVHVHFLSSLSLSAHGDWGRSLLLFFIHHSLILSCHNNFILLWLWKSFIVLSQPDNPLPLMINVGQLTSIMLWLWNSLIIFVPAWQPLVSNDKCWPTYLHYAVIMK